MKRILGIAFALCLLGSPALATCPTTLQLKDNAGVTPTAKYTDDGAGNCIANVDVWQWGGSNLGAMANYGTSPGAVLVPGVNAFITNTPTVSVPTWAGGTLGAMANYGTSPGAVLVPGVNAFITNASPNGAHNTANSPTVNIASDQAGTCPNHGFKHITSATDTLAVQGATSQVISLCAWKARAAGTATWFWENTASTNANCSSSNTQISGVATEAANTGEVVSLPLGVALSNTSGNGLCINSTGTGGVDIDYWYAQR